MGIEELIPEYRKTEQALRDRLNELKELYKTPQYANASLLQRRIEVMTDELYEVRRVITYLLGRYCPQEGWRE